MTKKQTHEVVVSDVIDETKPLASETVEDDTKEDGSSPDREEDTINEVVVSEIKSSVREMVTVQYMPKNDHPSRLYGVLVVKGDVNTVPKESFESLPKEKQACYKIVAD